MRRIQRLGVVAALASAVVLITLSAAFADDEDDFDRARTELGFGMLAGGYSVGPVSGPGVGVHFDLGRQMGPLLISGEYNLLSVGEAAGTGDDRPIRGLLHRVGLNARYSFAEFGGGRKIVKGAFWLEAGLGRQMINWDEGGRLSREDVGLGFGIQTNFKIGRHKPNPKIIGFYYAFRATVAESPGSDKMPEGPPVCGGPCDEPTQPSPYDVGMFFNVGLTWGH